MDVIGIAGLVGVVCCVAATRAPVPPRRPRRNGPTFWMAVAVSASLLAQLRWPELLPMLRRDGGAIRAGQVYRVLTSLFVQDAGFVGGVFNVAMLLVVGRTAEASLGPAKWLWIYFAGGMATELVAISWQPVGAGNSIAYLSLGGALLFSAAARPLAGARRAVAALGFALAVVLCARWDIHGAAVMIGAVLGWVALMVGPRGGNRTPPVDPGERVA